MYRPISLLPAVSKIYLLELHDLFYDNHFGFRHKHSKIDTVTKLITDTCKALKENEATLAVTLDLSRAFDAIHHSI